MSGQYRFKIPALVWHSLPSRPGFSFAMTPRGNMEVYPPHGVFKRWRCRLDCAVNAVEADSEEEARMLCQIQHERFAREYLENVEVVDLSKMEVFHATERAKWPTMRTAAEINEARQQSVNEAAADLRRAVERLLDDPLVVIIRAMFGHETLRSPAHSVFEDPATKTH